LTKVDSGIIFLPPDWVSVGTFIFTFFVGTLKEVWANGDWGQLLSARVFFSVGLFAFSLFIPKS